MLFTTSFSFYNCFFSRNHRLICFLSLNCKTQWKSQLLKIATPTMKINFGNGKIKILFPFKKSVEIKVDSIFSTSKHMPIYICMLDTQNKYENFAQISTEYFWNFIHASWLSLGDEGLQIELGCPIQNSTINSSSQFCLIWNPTPTLDSDKRTMSIFNCFQPVFDLFSLIWIHFQLISIIFWLK